MMSLGFAVEPRQAMKAGGWRRHSVISSGHNNQVAFGEKRTSTGRHDRLAQSRMTLNGHGEGV
jgi:hypothetical protein